MALSQSSIDATSKKVSDYYLKNAYLLSGDDEEQKIIKIRNKWIETIKDDFKDSLKDVSMAQLRVQAVENSHFIYNSIRENVSPTKKETTYQQTPTAATEEKKFIDEKVGTGRIFGSTYNPTEVNALGDKLPPPTDEQKQRKASENRLNEQAALILTMDEVLSKIYKVSTDNNQSTQLKVTDRIFKNFAAIRPEDGNVGHSFLTSYLTKTPSMSQFFKHIPTQVMSFLIPSIKVFKTFYINTNGYTKEPIGFDWRIPFDDVPVATGNQTGNQFSDKTADEILNGNGGLRGVGIKSFSYEYKGTNPAEINTNIHATMDIFFQNPSELVKKINFGLDDPRFIVKPNNVNKSLNFSFSYSDLINQAAREINGTFNDEYYRIKIECGYANIPQKIIQDLLQTANYSPEDQKKIIDAIRATKVVLVLSPYNYDVAFNEDSTVSLKINYNCAMDVMMSSPDADLFSLTKEASELITLSKQYEAYISSVSTGNTNINDAPVDIDCPTDQEKQKLIEEFKKNHSDLVGKTTEEILQDLSKERTKVYNGLFNFLVGTETLHKEFDSVTMQPKIYIASFKPDIFGIRDQQEASRAITEKRIEQFLSTNQLINVFPSFYDDELKKASQISAPSAEATDVVQASINSLDTRMKAELEKIPNACNIRFMLLGDIIDVALESMKNISPTRELPRIAIGNIPIQIPTKFDEKSSSEYKELNPNLADIPISFNLFQEFMIKNVVAKKKTRYPIIQFLKDIISELVYPALQPNVLGRSTAINASIRFSTANLSFQTIDGIDPFSIRDAEKRYYPPTIDKKIENFLQTFNANRQKAIADIQDPTHLLTSPTQMNYVNYTFITCTSKFPRTINGIEEDDIKKGILHMRMGSDTGIIKKISFSKVDAPYQREMLARREGDGRGTSLKQFYNAEIEMFGNNIFRPGDFIYIHPNYMYTIKPTKKIEKDSSNQVAVNTIDLEGALGVGGYYLVLGVQTSFNNMAYSTKLKCSFQAHVKKEQTAQTIKTKVIPINEDRCAKR